MIFYDEIYYEITLKGTKAELAKFKDFVLSGGLDDYIEFDAENVIYGDSYKQSPDYDICDLTLINEDGFPVDEFRVEEFLEVFCQAAINLEVYGFIYDADETEFNFTSEAGSDDFKNTRSGVRFNDELDDIRDEEDEMDDEF